MEKLLLSHPDKIKVFLDYKLIDLIQKMHLTILKILHIVKLEHIKQNLNILEVMLVLTILVEKIKIMKY